MNKGEIHNESKELWNMKQLMHDKLNSSEIQYIRVVESHRPKSWITYTQGTEFCLHKIDIQMYLLKVHHIKPTQA